MKHNLFKLAHVKPVDQSFESLNSEVTCTYFLSSLRGILYVKKYFCNTAD